MHLPERPVNLGYCTNIHPGNGWAAVLANLRRHAPAVRREVSPGAALGLGLRLSDLESRELARPGELEAFREFLTSCGLYVFTINGFPYGPFHGEPVKEHVFVPDWTTRERLAYTLRLAEILAGLLPPGEEGGISTVPLGYRPRSGRQAQPGPWPAALPGIMANLVVALGRLADTTGRTIHVDFEPEPDGLLECAADAAAFFEECLLRLVAPAVAWRAGRGRAAAEEAVLRHLRVCLDTCHMAVRFEDPAAVLDVLGAKGIRVGKVQISSALELGLADGACRQASAASLRPFADDCYLHQVVVQGPEGVLARFPDLGPALDRWADVPAGTCRIHFHVPLFAERFEAFGSTASSIPAILEAVARRTDCRDFEVETYTWDVLPPGLKADVADQIVRELRWAGRAMPGGAPCARPPS